MITEAHGLGGAQDLPISLSLAIVGAMGALAVSFVVLAIAWRSPRYAVERGRPGTAPLARLVDSATWVTLLRIVGLVFLGYLLLCAIAGKDLLTNPIFGIFYVWIWVGVPLLSLLLGPVWRSLSPWRTLNAALARLSASDAERGILRYPERLGLWPAAFGLLAFVWMELVYPHGTDLSPLRLWCAVYLAAMVVGGALFGNTFYDHADPFEVYSNLVAKVSVWGRGDHDQLVVRSPLANLDTPAGR